MTSAGGPNDESELSVAETDPTQTDEHEPTPSPSASTHPDGKNGQKDTSNKPTPFNKTTLPEVTTSPTTGGYKWTADKTMTFIGGGTGTKKTDKETTARDYGILALVSEMNLAFIHKQRKMTLFQHVYSDPNPTNNPKPMCLVVAAIAILTAGTFIILNLGDQDKVMKLTSNDSLNSAYSRGELVLRSTQMVVTLVMVYGVLAHAAALLLPFLVWTPFQALTSLIMFTMILYENEKSSILIGILAAWDVFAWGIVQSGRQMMFFDYILEAKFQRYLESTYVEGVRIKNLGMDLSTTSHGKHKHHHKHRKSTHHRKTGTKIKDKVESLLRTTKRNIQ